MRLELRHLRTLCAIADAGSLGAAAVALGFSQPAMSTQLRRLEELLGGQLFVRSAAGVGLTPFGSDVIDQARDILSRVDALTRGPMPTPAPDGPVTLRLGATITPVVADLVARLAAEHPEVSVTVKSEYSIGALVELLEADLIDVALVLDYPGRELRHSAAIAHRAFALEPAFVALPSGHRMAQRTEVPLAELAGEAWFVTPDDGAGWPDVFYEACRQAGFAPVRTHEFLDEKNMQRMIVAGVGISACQPTMKPIYGMVVKPIAGSPIRYRQLLAWRRESPAAQLAPALHQLATEVYRELVTQTSHYHAWTLRRERA
ncbi:DNA-binding transcriptional LysR family regulator [Allocatelliglobosispora scoriae]|uniref:DNA-binding transcriptional LysR family regulator n=1 Tax=Allocatelliglobosispora scoriae TaxID=643052 RepID=A0A841BX80_9ACTN|nr:LysR family transcriptional regulator [Allocatelliglobosispora scoriae]MBB5873747.1 DNA-binding transcriptional LysR family regulator [Allocatelliglobosispora scoriae]